jgi:hypothetical protein
LAWPIACAGFSLSDDASLESGPVAGLLVLHMLRRNRDTPGEVVGKA